MNGVDVLVNENFERLKGLRLGLITNHTGVSRSGTTTIDLFHKAANVDLKVLFSPEHGIRGTKDEAVGDGRDAGKQGCQSIRCTARTRGSPPPNR